jgi:hypothetical protein
VKRKQRTREEKEEEKLGRLATDISTTDGVQVSLTEFLFFFNSRLTQ